MIAINELYGTGDRYTPWNEVCLHSQLTAAEFVFPAGKL